MTDWKGLWRRPAIKGAVLSLLMFPLGLVVLLLTSLRFGLVGLLAYCALVPGTGLASMLHASPPWDLGLVLIGNGGILSAGFAAFTSVGRYRMYARAGVVVVYATLIWLSLIAWLH